jgi:PKD repeat protein
VDTVVGCVPYKVQFFDKSSVDVIEWDWQFENGIPATSKEKNPIVIFDKIGKYAVKLDVKNTNGSNSRTKTQYIQVVSSVLCPEHTKTSAFALSENEFGFNLEHRADNTNVVYPIIFPNPAQDYIYVKANASGKHPVQIEVFDLAGRKRSEHISKESEFRIPTDKLSSGTYYIKMNDGFKTSINKFIISN